MAGKIEITKMRNIGISAHIDSGKTTLSERILYYCRKIHAIHEVKGKDGVGATMDSMELEKERGITIASASTNIEWANHSINLIDTPGHVDFTIEVERALRVLDGAILVLCSVGGVQSQTITVDKQLKRHNISCIAFINKCDRIGANPLGVCEQIHQKLGRNTVLLQIPIGLESHFEGIVDLISMKAWYFEGTHGENPRSNNIPNELVPLAKKYRDKMIDTLSMYSDELAEACLKGEETPELIQATIRKATVERTLTPVFLGSAYKNKAIQPLLDGIVKYLPNPAEVIHKARQNENNEITLAASNELPLVALAFKIEDGRYGQLTYIRLYQGCIKKGDQIRNSRTRQTFKVGRLIRMHADNMEDIDSAGCGDIVSLFGIDCLSGDTFTSAESSFNYELYSMHIPEPVISYAIKSKDSRRSDAMTKVLNKFSKEDPTFKYYFDPESGETIIKGMGELHLEIYRERMKREYGIETETGMPQVAYRETVSCAASFCYTHKKQTGGAGQYAKIEGVLEPNPQSNYEFVNKIKGGTIPSEFIPSCDKGFRACLNKGALIGFPIVNVRVTIIDGNFHPVDSSDAAFMAAAIGGFREAYLRAKPEILEPVMKVVVETPSEFQGGVLSSLNQRRGIIIGTTEEALFSRIEAEVPLSEMFGYSTVLRSITQGKAEFSMEFLKYIGVPTQISEKLIKKFREKTMSKE